MIILKLVAWSDRPEERENDLSDILLIISKSYWIMKDSIIDFHTDAEQLLDSIPQAPILVLPYMLKIQAP
ncbi:hypothetical protein [Algoriphagus sp. NG3]|uniref:hypothetical protein n=1 Tax=Algoriphagus sp. NG3 TaxID=3097546 RepID=UPI002A83E7C7|nr:hypothetical protein [Algoriphagus sp. NG3]WPR73773.1 hypothetical protein SLW71_13900 [Algoriphagus sp. NG3]